MCSLGYIFTGADSQSVCNVLYFMLPYSTQIQNKTLRLFRIQLSEIACAGKENTRQMRSTQNGSLSQSSQKNKHKGSETGATLMVYSKALILPNLVLKTRHSPSADIHPKFTANYEQIHFLNNNV